MSDWTEELIRAVKPENIKYGEPMSAHTTFRIGGPADYYVTPVDSSMVQDTVRICRKHQIPFYIIGNGSNLLVSDEGYKGVMIEIGSKMSQVYLPEEKGDAKEAVLRAEAGISLSRLAMLAARKGLAGLEFAAGIPGTLGGGVTMNAGAYGGEIMQVIKSATVLDEHGEVRTLEKEQLDLGYRTSIIQKKGYGVLEASFCLEYGEEAAILEKVRDFNTRRREKQPLEYPSAGSTFKRPQGYFAGRLIEDTGLKGFQVGGAQVSTKHCGFVINTGDATAREVRQLIQEVDRRVFEKFGVHLEPEVRIL